MKTFYAYAWASGSYGIRNHVIVISAVDNSDFIARRMAACVTGAVEVRLCFGRGEVDADLKQHTATLGGLGADPSVFAAVVVTMEPVIVGRIADIIRDSGKEIVVYSYDECGGTINTTYRVVRYAKEFVIKTSERKRVEVPISELMLGAECGGFDSVSGFINNPATGMVVDKVVNEGGRVVLFEAAEWMGAEESLRTRAVTPELGQHIVDTIEWYENYIISTGVDIKGTNSAPDNIKGGLSTVEGKALGAMEKGGIRLIQDLITHNGKISHRGLTLLDTFPGGAESTTFLTSISCQLIVFPTGRGSPVGNPIMPTIKVTGDTRTVDSYSDNIDMDISAVMTEGVELNEADDSLYEHILEYCNGKLTVVEVFGDIEIAVMRLGYIVQETAEGKARKGADRLLCVLSWKGGP